LQLLPQPPGIRPEVRECWRKLFSHTSFP
jgi:hypothetical protein